MHRFMLIFFHKGKLFAALSGGRRCPLIFFGSAPYESEKMHTGRCPFVVAYEGASVFCTPLSVLTCRFPSALNNWFAKPLKYRRNLFIKAVNIFNTLLTNFV